MNLSQLKRGESARIVSVGGSGSLRQHFLDMGLIPGKKITYVKAAPLGDPIEYRIWSYELTLRLEDAEKIEIKDITDDKPEPAQDINCSQVKRSNHHPGHGEMGKYHNMDGSEAENFDASELLTFGLAGNQNCGKTTLFNQLTGSNQHVGNFPGVTVDRKDGQIRKIVNTSVTDLPGIYSMSPYTNEEVVTRNFFLDDTPKGIINIVDATNIERNLYLTLQLIELGIPMVLALNMMDEVRDNGGTVRINEMEEALGIPVIPISAAKNEGI
ncbi:MAG: FeoB small GTPase domain-containing protein, partial [Eubacteriaceae bacterium]|nr:FeoB small GTPase domain-containing protein [Eubacteriaceae bacterium]